MSSSAIKVENLSKQYRLGSIGSGVLADDLTRLWSKIRGRGDPFELIGDVNKRAERSKTDYVWALRDINFEVREGEVLGIIGKNGAGKSTLLKILSKVTSPTSGLIRMNGRIGSLLEVGTGFHPELSGRENIFMNGAILGMRKREIQSKLDEIIDFAGVDKYIDTPVKRYSSGMRVRLGFSVAAHLEPEILIVDEVLAVGDFEFQKKCIGKMNEVSKRAGRTVLFVSHNLASIKQLCTRALLLEDGEVKMDDNITNVLNRYYDLDSATSSYKCDASSKQAYFSSIQLKKSYSVTEPVEGVVEIKSNINLSNVSLQCVADSLGVPVFCSFSSDSHGSFNLLENETRRIKILIHPQFLKAGSYYLNFVIRDYFTGAHIDAVINQLNISISDYDVPNIRYLGFEKNRPGFIIPKVDWVMDGTSF